VVIVGHIGKALAEPVSLRSMRKGTVPARHAQRHNPRWWAELHEGTDRVEVPDPRP
jgi:cytochrome b subunit of formate dehydrogenase